MRISGIKVGCLIDIDLSVGEIVSCPFCAHKYSVIKNKLGDLDLEGLPGCDHLFEVFEDVDKDLLTLCFSSLANTSFYSNKSPLWFREFEKS